MAVTKKHPLASETKKSLVTMARILLRNKKYNESDCRGLKNRENSEFKTSVKERKKKNHGVIAILLLNRTHLNIFTY